jgi:lipoprotein-anchoring transpeptidase ErfK/SrfK
MPAVRVRPITALAAGGALALALAASPAAAQSPTSTTSSTAVTPTPPTTTTTPTAAPAKVFLKVSGRGQRIAVGGRIKAKGRIRPFVPGQRVEMRIARHGKVFRKQRVAVKPVAHSNLGRFRIRSGKVIKPGPYRVTALHAATDQQGRGRVVSKPISVHYPDLDPGQSSASVKVFTRLLAHQGYYTPRSRHYGTGVARAVLAYRKVNRMPRTMNATPGIFHTLAKGGGAFKPRYPGAGYHVEVDISRQVMVIVNHRKAQYTIAASTGAPATPTITGHYRVYRKDAGYNSEGMYYSSYWHNGYAVHGYASVPTFNASHGCVRIPIPDAIFVYNRLPIGTAVDTYY